MSNSSPGANGRPSIASSSLEFVEERYLEYLRDPQSVSDDWRSYFEEMIAESEERPSPKLDPTFTPRSLFHPVARTNSAAVSRKAVIQERIGRLIRSYRVRGHIVAKIDPLEQPRPDPPGLHPEVHGITDDDHNVVLEETSVAGLETATVRDILERLQNTYCQYIGVQYMHIDSFLVRTWLQDRMERTQNRITLNREEQLRILTRLTNAIVFESFLQKKFLGAKSFSLEGAETLIPLLDLAMEKAGDDGIEEVVIGMAHRGRLNVLANIMGKNPRDIFREFEDRDPERYMGRGDVKYHLGHSSDWETTSGHKIHLSLCFNPSHLEFVNTVAQGRLRAKQDRFHDRKHSRGMTLLIHGDAAFAGEGIVQETLNLSQLKAYSVGGTIHIVVNNQIGFTTPPSQGRSSTYATDVAKMLQIPIFHVNGENPEAVAQVIRLAMEFRKRFQRDVVIDMYCYRLRGHNEGDEPQFTQPMMYDKIEKRKSVRQGYLDHLLSLGEVTRKEADAIKKQARQRLESELDVARSDEYEYRNTAYQGLWSPYTGGPDKATPEVETGADPQLIRQVLEAVVTVPPNFHVHPKLQRILDLRAKMSTGESPLDWATAELLAFGTLAREGTRVRLTGQDCRRGTFSQRHAVIYDNENGHSHHLLRNLGGEQAWVEIENSCLSEAGVLGFEYGYSLDCPDGLILWEAQFGDFNNAAQVIIDQFISSAEDKWHRLSGLVMMLPHGFEGQGPEHSSARLERFLTLAAEDNMQIVMPSTPAQHYHCLRRQVHRPWRKPLIMMTPKSLLRHKECVSTFDEFESGSFQRVLPDVNPKHKKVSRVLICSGKVYYDLTAYRDEHKREDVAIVRLEQFYPLDRSGLENTLSQYDSEIPVFWVQEEPENMGAWRFLYCNLGQQLCGKYAFDKITRPESASPATGSAKSHQIEQNLLMRQAFGD